MKPGTCAGNVCACATDSSACAAAGSACAGSSSTCAGGTCTAPERLAHALEMFALARESLAQALGIPAHVQKTSAHVLESPAPAPEVPATGQNRPKGSKLMKNALFHHFPASGDGWGRKIQAPILRNLRPPEASERPSPALLARFDEPKKGKVSLFDHAPPRSAAVPAAGSPGLPARCSALAARRRPNPPARTPALRVRGQPVAAVYDRRFGSVPAPADTDRRYIPAPPRPRRDLPAKRGQRVHRWHRWGLRRRSFLCHPVGRACSGAGFLGGARLPTSRTRDWSGDIPVAAGQGLGDKNVAPPGVLGASVPASRRPQFSVSRFKFQVRARWTRLET